MEATDRQSSGRKRYSVCESIEFPSVGAYDVYDNHRKRVWLNCLTLSEARKLRVVLNRRSEINQGCKCDTWVIKYGAGHIGPGGTRVRRWHSNGGVGYSLPIEFKYCPQCGCELKESPNVR